MGPEEIFDPSIADGQRDSRPSSAGAERCPAEADVNSLLQELQRQAAARADLEQAVQRLRAELARRTQQEAALQLDRELYQTLRESAFRESEERYRLLFESAFDAVILYDTASGSFLDANQAARTLYGYSREEFQKMTVERISAEPDKTRQATRRSVTDGACKVPLRYHRKKDGTVFPVEATCACFSLGGRIILCTVIRDISERIAAEQQAAKYRDQLRGMALQLSLAEEQERRRLAILLHDELGQFLTLAQLKLGLVRDPARHFDAADGKLLADIDDLLSRANRSARSLTFQLSHPALYDLGFVPAAEWLCEEMRRLYNLHIQMSDDAQPKPLDVNARVVLFQSLREILINVAKHAQVSTARLDVQRVDSTVVVSVQDMGIGFDPGFTASRGRACGFGLFSVRERLHHLGGEFQIESEPGHGTRVRLQVPLTTETGKEQDRENP